VASAFWYNASINDRLVLIIKNERDAESSFFECNYGVMRSGVSKLADSVGSAVTLKRQPCSAPHLRF
jgi:hypothetical protein